MVDEGSELELSDVGSEVELSVDGSEVEPSVDGSDPFVDAEDGMSTPRARSRSATSPRVTRSRKHGREVSPTLILDKRTRSSRFTFTTPQPPLLNVI